MTEVEPRNPAKVRKKRSRPSFFLVMSVALVALALKSHAKATFSAHAGQSHQHLSSAAREARHTSSSGTSTTTSSAFKGDQEAPGTTAIPTLNQVSSTHASTHHHSSSASTTATPPSQGPNATEATDPFGGVCNAPGIEQFPKPIMSQKTRLYGGFIYYFIITAYTFLALAVICDEFFVPSLDIMCEVLRISPDVAGATFMAAGSSAPELATALIGVFVAKDDIGVSGVIGSAVFNIMFVISICGLLTPEPLYLNWWPLVRDCFFYMVSILALLGAIIDESIEWYESVIFLILYGVYCYVMYMNEVLEAWAHTLPFNFPVHAVQPNENSSLVMYNKQPPGAGDSAGASNAATGTSTPFDTNTYQTTTTSINLDDSTSPTAANPPAPGPRKVCPQTENITRLFEAPSETGWKKLLWQASLPLVYLFYYTVPDCRMDKWRTWYVVTFTMAMVWIAVFSYIMVWMITILGFTVGIPDTVMGLTFVAAGVSVPDALSSLAVLKEGFGDMAVSNAVGSNVFDILVCLGLPWFLSTVIVNPGRPVTVYSKGLTYSTFSLLSTVAFLLIATHYNGWKLDKKYGVILMIWYVFFMTFASLYELNIFGFYNPPECASNY